MVQAFKLIPLKIALEVTDQKYGLPDVLFILTSEWCIECAQ